MATSVVLNWLAFSVDLSQVNAYLRANLSSNYDGLVATPDDLTVAFKSDVSDQDSGVVTTYWNGLTSTSFNPTPSEIVEGKIQAAIGFGQNLLIQYSTQNVLMGITQAGKTQAVMDYCHEMTHCLLTGSLYAAISEINTMIADTSDTKTALSPFVTNVLLYSYLNQIQTYLGLPITPNPGS